jgi:hypothetical protein
MAASAAISRKKPARRRPRPADDPSRLPGLDARTAAGKRFTQIAGSIIADYPGADIARVRELALLRLSIELRQGRLLSSDDPSQSDQLIRLSNLAARRERDLRLRRRPVKQPTFIERLLIDAKGAPTS